MTEPANAGRAGMYKGGKDEVLAEADIVIADLLARGKTLFDRQNQLTAAGDQAALLEFWSSNATNEDDQSALELYIYAMSHALGVVVRRNQRAQQQQPFGDAAGADLKEWQDRGARAVNILLGRSAPDESP